ncbi:hypothetical protein SHKM778_53920 [Streptomyces sp. KM77-8]|uniref:PepSY domain-containing protein n=1 Tax=Streptomyces haneummycinicus TaxID=3074435 RepID=A0AAT9HNL3_9ACTN
MWHRSHIPPGNQTARHPDYCTTTPPPYARENPSDDHRSLDHHGRGPATPAPAPAKSVWAGLRPLVLRLHFYAGVLVAPFLLVAALTGLLYAASFQAEKIVYDHELTVPVGDRKLPVSAQVAAAREAHPEGTIAAVRPSAEADATTRVMLSGTPGVDPGHTLAVFVDPYTAEVRGELEQYGSSGALPLRTWIDEFHRDLHLGETGRLYSEFAASWLWVIAGGGLVLWFSRRRALRKIRGTSGRRRTLALHGGVGVWAATGFIFLSATGLTWSTYAGANIGELRTSLGQETPRCPRRPANTRATTRPAARRVTRRTGWAWTRSSRRPAPRAWATRWRSCRPPTRSPRTSCSRSSAAGPRSRTRSPSTRPPARSPTSCGSTTIRCWRSSPAGASTCTRATCSAW